MILIILPVKNEAKTIRDTAKKVSAFVSDNFSEYKILFVDDKSIDSTWDILSKLKIKNKILMRNKYDCGKGSALKAAYIYANTTIKMGYADYIVFLDGDGQIRPSEINTFLNLHELYSADVVIGNKRHLYSNTIYGFSRRVISSGYNALIRFLFDIDFRDTQCGIKLFRKTALDKIIENVNVKKFAFDLELIIACKEMNLRIVDAPVFIDKRNNKGSVSLISIIQTFCDTLMIWIRKKRGYYSG